MQTMTVALGRSAKSKLCTAIIAAFIVIGLPCVQFGIFHSFMYKLRKPEVDVDNCENFCWDTKFKGDYELMPSGYKHVYFNLTQQTCFIWTVTIIFSTLLYEACKYSLHLLLTRQIRFQMFILFVSVIHSHYYTWWSLFNYFNDDFYDQLLHQAIFSTTEILSTVCVFKMMHNNSKLDNILLLIIFDVSIFHILSSSLDQFIVNVLLRRGYLFQTVRDLSFMIPDVLHAFISFTFLRSNFRSSQNEIRALQRSHIYFSIVAVLCLFVIVRTS